MPNANLHVVPHQGKWAVQLEGSGKATSIHATQAEAIDSAREIAHRIGTLLVIHEAHGRIESRKHRRGQGPGKGGQR